MAKLESFDENFDRLIRTPYDNMLPVYNRDYTYTWDCWIHRRMRYLSDLSLEHIASNCHGDKYCCGWTQKDSDKARALLDARIERALLR